MELHGHMQEILLHDTAVSWIRCRLAQTLPKECWKETPAEYEARLKRVVADINANLDVEGLCRRLPDRLRKLVDAIVSEASFLNQHSFDTAGCTPMEVNHQCHMSLKTILETMAELNFKKQPAPV